MPFYPVVLGMGYAILISRTVIALTIILYMPPCIRGLGISAIFTCTLPRSARPNRGHIGCVDTTPNLIIFCCFSTCIVL